MSGALNTPSASDRARLIGAWTDILHKIGETPARFPLHFGRKFDSPRCIFAHADGWALVDVFRGEEHGCRLVPDDDQLLYLCARAVTFALAGWKVEATKSRSSNAVSRILHRIDRTLNWRLQWTFETGRLCSVQLKMMEQISGTWADRLRRDISRNEVE